MSTTNLIHPRPSPLRVINHLVGRMRTARATHGDCGGMLEVEILDEQTAALRADLQANVSEANSIETGAAEIINKVREIAADGVIDADERRWLDRAAPQFTRLTRAHHVHAEGMLR